MTVTDKLEEADQKRLKIRKKVVDRWRALKPWQRWLFVAAGVFVLYALPDNRFPASFIRTDFSEGGASWSGVLFLCAVYALVAIGLNVVIGLAGLLDLGYVGFFAIGAYSVALFGSLDSPVVKALQAKFNLGSEWAVAWAICIPIAIAFTMLSGVLLGWPTLRLRGDYLAIVTMGFGEIIRIIARNSDFTNATLGINNIPGPEGPASMDNVIFRVIDPTPWYWMALTVVLLLVVAVRRLEHSRVGRAWAAVREDEDAAAIMGVHGFRFKLWAFAIGAALGGMSGVLFASRQGYIDPSNFSLVLSITFVAMVVIGGSGNMMGVALGAVLLTYLPERFRDFIDWRPFMVGVALVVVMVLKPTGLIPSRRRARELRDRAEEAEAVNV
ncbi:MAG TPA: branched-chain amino acid ABC transporter permease [Candidatus Limnocylindrales bacterium]|nr:branched-chain amino acid ABC transporter permease [Candidatus Limnocylindrales bacterium]